MVAATATRKRKPMPRPETLARRVADVLDRATPDDVAAGLTWYADARALAAELDPANVERAAGIIAALSPQAHWTANAQWARQTYATGRAVGNTGPNRAKAQAILDGARPLDVLGGPKVRAFYANITDPTSIDAVTVDRHAYDIANGRRAKDGNRNALTRAGMYDRYVRAYELVARDRGLAPSAVQAITWVAWRRMHGITV